MTALWYLLWFLIAVSLLVTVHEFGHYWVARRLGFKVLRFSVGFGKPILSWRGKRDQIEYWICPIPLGGYVKMLDEREGPVPPEELSRSFTRQHPLKRILVLLAGPGFNFIFAIGALSVILWAGGMTRYLPVIGHVQAGSIAARAGVRRGDRIVAINGAPVDSQRQVVLRLLDVMSGNGDARVTVRSEGATRALNLDVRNPAQRRALTGPKDPLHGLGMHFWEPTVPPVLGQVLPGGPAARAGLRAGDRIVAVDGHAMKNFQDIVAAVSPNPGKTLAITYRRGVIERTVDVTTKRVTVDGRVIGRIEAAQPMTISYPPGMVQTAPLGPLGALTHAVHRIWTLTRLQARLLWRMALGRVSIKNIGGPLTIAEDAGQSASAGLGSFVGFLVLISMELGFLNLLPIPVLDGGQILFQAIEWVKGAPLSERAQIIGQQVGIALLILLMGVAVFNDIARQFG